jgi:hypothetical protein
MLDTFATNTVDVRVGSSVTVTIGGEA